MELLVTFTIRVMDLNPKERFLKSEYAKTFADISVNPAFHAAIETALSETQLHPPKGSDAAANWNRLEGAKEFAHILLNLAEPPVPFRRGAPRENLQPT